jgi:hypothetical protein
MATANLPLEKTLSDARKLATRFQEAPGFRDYLHRRLPLVIPAALLFVLISLACTAGTVIFLADRHPMLALPGLILAPLVLLGSFFIQVYVFFGWLEGRALAKALGPRGARPKGPLGAWMLKNLRIDMGQRPAVPWSLAGLFLLLPLAMLIFVFAKAALVLILLAVLTPIIFARFDR